MRAVVYFIVGPTKMQPILNIVDYKVAMFGTQFDISKFIFYLGSPLLAADLLPEN